MFYFDLSRPKRASLPRRRSLGFVRAGTPDDRRTPKNVCVGGYKRAGYDVFYGCEKFEKTFWPQLFKAWITRYPLDNKIWLP